MASDRTRRLTIIVALIGIVLELVGIALLAAQRIAYPMALPMIVVGSRSSLTRRRR